MKKSPILPPASKPQLTGKVLPTSTVLGDPELDPGGQEVYQNTDFGDLSGDSDLYANIPQSQQTQKGLNGHHMYKQPY